MTRKPISCDQPGPVHTVVLLYPCTPLGISGNVECLKDGPITFTEYIVKRGEVSGPGSRSVFVVRLIIGIKGSI